MNNNNEKKKNLLKKPREIKRKKKILSFTDRIKTALLVERLVSANS